MFEPVSLGAYSQAVLNQIVGTLHVRYHDGTSQDGCNLVPRASFPLTSGRKTRALGATISGMRHRCRCAVSQITRIRLFPLFFQNGCSQSSRFLPQARRIVGSGTRMGRLPEVNFFFFFFFPSKVPTYFNLLLNCDLFFFFFHSI